jgi:hypothetical protein
VRTPTLVPTHQWSPSLPGFPSIARSGGYDNLVVITPRSLLQSPLSQTRNMPIGLLDMPNLVHTKIFFFVFYNNLYDRTSYGCIGQTCIDMRRVQMNEVPTLLCILARSPPESSWAPGLLVEQEEVDIILPMLKYRAKGSVITTLYARNGGWEALWTRRKEKNLMMKNLLVDPDDV